MLEIISYIVAFFFFLAYLAAFGFICSEIRSLKALLSRENPSQIEKPMLKRKGRRTARFTDKSAKWLASKGKKDKEVY